MSHEAVLRAARDALLSDDDAPATALGLSQYRSLVRGRFASMLRNAFPHAQRWVGDEIFDSWIGRWLSLAPPHSREVHRTLMDFADFVLADRIRDCGADVVAYERALVHAANATETRELVDTVDIALPAGLHSSAKLLPLAWDVPQWIAEGAAEPEQRALTLLVYRDRELRVRALSLGADAVRFVAALAGGVPRLADAVLAGFADTDGWGTSLEELAGLLEDLAARGVLVKRAPAPGE